MVNQSTSCKRVSDCSPLYSIMRKRSNSEAPEDRPSKQVSFAVHGGRYTSRTNSQSQRDWALIEPPITHCDGIEVSGYRRGSVDVGGFRDAVPSPVLEASVCRTNDAGNNRERNSSSLFVKALPSNSSNRTKYQTKFSHDITKSGQSNVPSVSPTTLCPNNGPAKDIAWCGTFEVLDCGNIRICEAIIGHLSQKVSPKAFEQSKMIAPLVQLKLHPRMDFYPEIFQEVSPDRDDIALYFYPTKQYDKSSKQYSDLLKDMGRKDLMLRSQMNGIELLVFPSTVMHANSQLLNRSYFMWGIFRRRQDGDGLF